MDALQKSLKVKPAITERFPAGRTISWAPKVTALTCDGIPTLLRRQLGCRHLGQIGHNLDDLIWHRLTGWLLWRQASNGTQLQQADSHWGKQPQHTPQPVIGLQLPLFDATSRFESLVIVFDSPTHSVPLDPFPSVFNRVDRNRGDQDPFKRVFSFNRILFPSAYHPSCHRLPCCGGSLLWRLNAHRLPRDGKRGGSGFAICRCRQIEHLFLASG